MGREEYAETARRRWKLAVFLVKKAKSTGKNAVKVA